MSNHQIERCRAQIFRTLVLAGMQGKKISGHEITPPLVEAICDHLEELLELSRQKDEELGYRGAKYRRLDLLLLPVLLELEAK